MNTLSNTLYSLRSRLCNYFFADRYDANPMTALRIGTGMILLLQFLVLKPDLMAFIQNNGIVRQDLSTIRQLPFQLNSYKIVNYMTAHFHLSEFKSLQILGTAYIACTVCVILGLFTRISSVILTLLHIAFVASGHFFSYGVDYFLSILLFYIVIFPVNRELSLDKYLFRLRKPVIYTPYVRVLQMHIGLVYFISGIAKALGENWWNGISILKAVVRPDESMFSNVKNMGQLEWLYITAGIATLVVEIGYIFFVNMARTRRLWLWLTCGMHLSIAFVLNLPFFAATMILFNVVAYYYPQKAVVATQAEQAPELQTA